MPRVAVQHDAQRADALWLGMAYPPCQLTEATDQGVLESSGVGLPAVCAKRFPVGRVPGTTALVEITDAHRAQKVGHSLPPSR